MLFIFDLWLFSTCILLIERNDTNAMGIAKKIDLLFINKYLVGPKKDNYVAYKL